jgi:hypothetical protein
VKEGFAVFKVLNIMCQADFICISSCCNPIQFLNVLQTIIVSWSLKFEFLYGYPFLRTLKTEVISKFSTAFCGSEMSHPTELT